MRCELFLGAGGGYLSEDLHGRPVATAGGDGYRLRLVEDLDAEGVEARLRRGWLEAEDVAVGDVIGELGEACLEVELVAEAHVLTAGQRGDLGGGVGAHGFESDAERGAEVEGIDDGGAYRGELVGGISVPGTGELVFEPGFLGGEGDAVDGGVGFADTPDDVGDGGCAPLVVGLAEEEEDAAGGGGLLLEETEPGTDGVEDGSAAISGFGMGEGVRESVDAGGEVPELLGAAVEGDEGDVEGGAGDEGFDERCEVAVAGKLARGGSAGLHEDDEGEGLERRLLESDLLLDAVVRDAEVGGVEVGDEIARGGADQGGNEDQRGRGVDGRGVGEPVQGDSGRGRRRRRAAEWLVEGEVFTSWPADCVTCKLARAARRQRPWRSQRRFGSCSASNRLGSG